MTNTQTKNLRLEYIDSMRGFAMLLVIYFHLLGYTSESHSVINEYVIRWRMPLFFFISGFFALLKTDDSGLLKSRSRNRLFKQLYPTIVIWFLFILFSAFLGGHPLTESIKHGIYDSTKLGYWFTISLVEVYFIYAFCAIILFRTKISLKSQGWIYLAVAVGLGVFYLTAFQHYHPQGLALKIFSVMSVDKFTTLIPFFFLGVFCRIFQERILDFMGKVWFMIPTVALFFGASFLSDTQSDIESALYFLSRIAGLCAVVSLFICFSRYFNTTTALGRYLNRIGRNTLPIYLFHFFLILLLPYCFSGYYEFKSALEEQWWIELPVVGAISVLTAELCLGFDRLLKRWNTCHRLIFNPV